MTDDLHHRFQEAAVSSQEPAPVASIIARAERLRQHRRLRGSLIAGFLVILVAAFLVVQLTQPRSTQIHVVGPTTSTAPTATGAASAVPSATQREVAISLALLRYEIGQLMPTATATTPGSDPSASTFYVQDQFFDYSPTSTMSGAFTVAGPVPPAVQAGIVKALAPVPLAFVPNAQAATLPSCQVGGAGYVFRLGRVPPSGDQVQVYFGVGVTAGGWDGLFGLARAGQAWTVTGKIGNGHIALGGCG